jgi:hypothetical protein
MPKSEPNLYILTTAGVLKSDFQLMSKKVELWASSPPGEKACVILAKKSFHMLDLVHVTLRHLL